MKLNQNKKPPRWAAWLLFRLSHHEDRYSIADDLEIEYEELTAEKGSLIAWLWYVLQVFRAIPEFLLLAIYWRITMFKNYLKIAFRNLKRHKGYSFINISGLALGMACCILILLWVQDELSFDRFHKNANEIYRVVVDEIHQDGNIQRVAVTPWPLGAALLKDYPEVINFTRYRKIGRSLITYNPDNKSFYEKRIYVADPSFLEMFSFPLVKGDPTTALSKGNTVVITEETAEKYFGKKNPIGKTITIDNNQDFTVTGIITQV